MALDRQTEEITFDITLVDKRNNRNEKLKIPGERTVWYLKIEIFDAFKIRPSKQYIVGWYSEPKDNCEILNNCINQREQHLILYNIETLKEWEQSAATKFRDCLLDPVRSIHSTPSLEEALITEFIAPSSNKRLLLLCFHNRVSGQVRNMLLNNYFKNVDNKCVLIIGWDTTNKEYHPALIRSLKMVNQSVMSELGHFIEKETFNMFLIIPTSSSFMLFSQVDSDTLLETIQEAEPYLEEHRQRNKSEISSLEYQQMMLKTLGDHTYYRFDYFELQQLKQTMGVAIRSLENTYNNIEVTEIKHNLFNKIIHINNLFVKHNDRVVVSYIYNCTLPKNNSKLRPIPVFILRKCKKSTEDREACRIFIDHTGRVYDSWQGYITENTLPKCTMVLPQNGRYEANSVKRVLLERHLSPSCGFAAKVLELADTTAYLLSLVPLQVIALAAPTILPPFIFATKISVGVYLIIRNALILRDRAKHKESNSFRNLEARAAYCSIAAAALNFATRRAMVELSKAVQMIRRFDSCEKVAKLLIMKLLNGLKKLMEMLENDFDTHFKLLIRLSGNDEFVVELLTAGLKSLKKSIDDHEKLLESYFKNDDLLKNLHENASNLVDRFARMDSNREERKRRRREHNTKSNKIICQTCGGYYYK